MVPDQGSSASNYKFWGCDKKAHTAQVVVFILAMPLQLSVFWKRLEQPFREQGTEFVTYTLKPDQCMHFRNNCKLLTHAYVELLSMIQEQVWIEDMSNEIGTMRAFSKFKMLRALAQSSMCLRVGRVHGQNLGKESLIRSTACSIALKLLGMCYMHMCRRYIIGA